MSARAALTRNLRTARKPAQHGPGPRQDTDKTALHDLDGIAQPASRPSTGQRPPSPPRGLSNDTSPVPPALPQPPRVPSAIPRPLLPRPLRSPPTSLGPPQALCDDGRSLGWGWGGGGGGGDRRRRLRLSQRRRSAVISPNSTGTWHAGRITSPALVATRPNPSQMSTRPNLSHMSTRPNPSHMLTRPNPSHMSTRPNPSQRLSLSGRAA